MPVAHWLTTPHLSVFPLLLHRDSLSSPLHQVRHCCFLTQIFPKDSFQEMNQQEWNKIKIPNHVILQAFQKLLYTCLLFRLWDLPGRIITSNRGITSRTKGNGFVLAAGLCGVCQLTALAQLCCLPFLCGCYLLLLSQAPCQVGPTCSAFPPAIALSFS